MTILASTNRRHSTAAAITLGLLLGVSGVGSAHAAPADAGNATVSWAVAPATAEAPDGRISLRHEVDAGARVSDHIAVSNLGAEIATFAVVAGDGMVGPGGAFDVRQGDPVDSGSWVTIDELTDGTVDVAPGETRILPVTVRVPADATPGDHPAGIVVGIASEGSDGVRVDTRVGVRVHLRVLGDVTAELGLDVSAVSYEPSWNPFAPGVVSIAYTLANSGNVRVSPAVITSTRGPFGFLASNAVAETPAELLPGDVVHLSMDLPFWPVILLTGSLAAAPSAVGEDTWQAGVTPSSADFQIVAMPWVWAAALGLVVAIAVVFIVRARRPRRG